MNTQILVRCISCGYTVDKDSNILDHINMLHKFRCKQCRHFGATIFITQDSGSPNTFIDQQNQQKESLLSEMTELSQRKKTLQALIIKHSSKKEELDSEMGELNSRYASLQTQTQALDQQASELAQRKTELEASVEQLLREVGRLEQSRREPEEISRRKQIIQQLEGKCKDLEKEEQEAASRLSQINELITRKVELEQEISRYEQELSTEKRTYQKIAQKLNKNQTELEELQSKPPFTRGAGWQDEEKRLEQEINQLNEQKSKKRKYILKIKQVIISIKQEREQLDPEISAST